MRIGESAARDQRIAVSCTKDGGECGQGWFQHSSSGAIADKLALIVHWRVCHVWDWLLQADLELGFPTLEIAKVYGQDVSDGEESLNARTGCIGCPLVQRDAALDRVVAQPEGAYLKPLEKLRPLYWEIKKPQYRHRKHGEVNKDGSLAAKQNRLGPLHMDARRWMLEQVLVIQAEVNDAARSLGKPELSLINDEELARIEALIAANIYPERWEGQNNGAMSGYQKFCQMVVFRIYCLMTLNSIALAKSLCLVFIWMFAVSTARLTFLNQTDAGSGDYTKERHQWQDGLTVTEIVTQIMERRKQA